MKKILIFTATYNEAENIKDFLLSVTNLYDTFDILIVDDNSPDKTWLIIEEFKLQSSKKITLIKRKEKEGLNTAHKLGFNFAVKNNYDYLITMDADLGHNPLEIPNFIEKIPKIDRSLIDKSLDKSKLFQKDEDSMTIDDVINNYYSILDEYNIIL